MGSRRLDAGREGGLQLTRVVRVVPDVPSFSVDDGFSYVLPDTVGDAPVGSIVRVPLGGRRVRGWVVDILGSAPTAGLRALLSRSGDQPIFDEKLLEVLRWGALHHVAPLAGVLPRAGPPNLPRGRPGARRAAAATGRRTSFVESGGPWAGLVADRAEPVLAAGASMLVVVASVREAEAMAEALAGALGDAVVERAWSELPAKEVTRAWQRTGVGGVVLVGTRETALWHLPALGHVVVVDPSRRSLKSKRTPTFHARDVVRRRAAVERFSLTYAGSAPPAELVAAGVFVHPAPGRAWAVVEVVDAAEEGPGAGPVLERTRAAIRGVAAKGGTVFVHVPRRGHAPAHRCVRCGTLRRCHVCGAGPDRGSTCRRCGAVVGPCRTCGGDRFQALGLAVGRVVEDLARSLGASVGVAGSGAPVEVGTEQDLPLPATRDLAVSLDPDRLWLAPHYRAEEEAIRILGRLAATVRRGRGRRCVVQTADPGHRVVAALRSGHASALVSSIVAERTAGGLPPGGELIAVEVRGEQDSVDGDLRGIAAGEAEVYGPADSGDRWRWLVQGRSLHRFRVQLRPVVQGWRDRGLAVRIDADPIDL